MYKLFALSALLCTVIYGAQCPDDWELYMTTNSSCIKGFKEEKAWLDAYMFCQSQGGNLVSIHNAFQNTHVSTVAEQTFAACLYWLGLSDIDKSGEYKWADNTSMDYQNWADGQPPSNREGTTVYLSITGHFRWYASTDIAETNCFVCEKVISDESSTTFVPAKTTAAPTMTAPHKTETPCAPCQDYWNLQECGYYAHVGECIQLENCEHICFCYATNTTDNYCNP